MSEKIEKRMFDGRLELSSTSTVKTERKVTIQICLKFTCMSFDSGSDTLHTNRCFLTVRFRFLNYLLLFFMHSKLFIQMALERPFPFNESGTCAGTHCFPY